MKTNSVKSINRSETLPCRKAGVVETIYDIGKAHGKELKVETIEGEGTYFIIQLPLKS